MKIFKPKAKEFKTLKAYWLWYYRKKPIWNFNYSKHLDNLAENRKKGYFIRMARIKARKLERNRLAGL